MDPFRFDPPSLDAATVRSIAADHWGRTGEIEQLRGERSHNSLITTADGERCVLQVQSASESPDVIDCQTRAMLHLEVHAPEVPSPRVIPCVDGEPLATVRLGDRTHLARLVTFLPGDIFDADRPLADDRYVAIGRMLGTAAAALAGFSHPAADHFMPWNIGNGLIVDDELRASMGTATQLALGEVDGRLRRIADAMRTLPHQTIHNDGHAGNLVQLTGSDGVVAGLIDFGDLVHTVTAADVAVCAESFAPPHADPAAVLAAIAAGYHERRPLSEAEVVAVPELVLARLALTVLLVEHQSRFAVHLAPRAALILPDLVDRLRQWAALDHDRLADRIRARVGS